MAHPGTGLVFRSPGGRLRRPGGSIPFIRATIPVTQTTARLTTSDLGLLTEDGVPLSVTSRRHDYLPRATVVVVHGFSAGKDHPSIEGLGGLLFADGFDVLTYDSRGHGGSGGVCTMGESEAHDVAAVLDHVEDWGMPVVVVGVSVGAVAVVRHLSQTPSTLRSGNPVAGVVLVSSPAHWRVRPSLASSFLAVVTSTRLGRSLAARRLGVRIDPSWQRTTPPVAGLSCLGVPVAVVHGARDRLLSRRHAKLLFESAAERRDLAVVPGMGHGVVDRRGQDAVRRAVEWVIS